MFCFIAASSSLSLASLSFSYRLFLFLGTITSVHVVKTPNYIQIQGSLDGTKINIQFVSFFSSLEALVLAISALNSSTSFLPHRPGDQGGELDPHGATGEGNPVSFDSNRSWISLGRRELKLTSSPSSSYPTGSSHRSQLEIALLGSKLIYLLSFHRAGRRKRHFQRLGSRCRESESNDERERRRLFFLP